MNKPCASGISRVINAFGYSMKGLAACWRHEAAFRQEVILAIILLPLAVVLARNAIELIVLVMSIFLVLMAELANSSIEAVVDRIGSEKHELAGRAKDIGSALVFVSLVLIGLVWGILLFDRFCPGIF